MSHAVEARRLLRTCRSGALATLSARLNGHPFASIVPFMTDYDASPIVLVSRLAEHTKNIVFDPRVSLMVHEPNADVQAAARLTIAGLCRRFEPDAALRERYLRHYPGAGDLLALDFEFHRIVPSAIRYIGGFGKIHWLSTTTFTNAGGIDAGVEAAWLAHLNASGAQAMPTPYGKGCVIALDCDGIDVALADSIHRRAFNESVQRIEELRAAIGELLERPAK